MTKVTIDFETFLEWAADCPACQAEIFRIFNKNFTKKVKELTGAQSK
jgi:hypothetical protein